jgi:DNA repair photolyase
MHPLHPPPKGRGAKSNASGRYESLAREDYDDGWRLDDAEPKQLQTILQAARARTILARNDSPDVGFDRSINPYRGCEHGCIYCFARPAHAYMGLSPGLDFETRLFFKPDAARLLEAELSNPRYRPGPIHIGGDTDSYQPAERKLQITRAVIEVLSRFNHPFSIITKSALILRDLDLLAPMAEKGLVRAAVSITTLDRKLARAMEPRAATPERRLTAVRGLAEAGVPVTVMFAPAIPGLNDHELEAVLEQSAEAGASAAGYVVLRLPLEIKDLFREWLEAERPDRARRVMSLVRQMRGGKDYDTRWNTRMSGEGPVAELIRQRFDKAKARYGLDGERESLRTDLFRRPPAPGDQIDLFAG